MWKEVDEAEGTDPKFWLTFAVSGSSYSTPAWEINPAFPQETISDSTELVAKQWGFLLITHPQNPSLLSMAILSQESYEKWGKNVAHKGIFSSK